MDADALTTKLTNAAFHREDTPTDEDMLENFISSAHDCHDTLVDMGGRPTRKVLEEPAGKAIYGENDIRVVDEHGELQITLNLEANLTVHHWSTECTRFKGEMDQWKEFRNYQQTMEQEPLLKIPFDPGSTDPRLTNTLVKLNDWREYQHYQLRGKVGRALMLLWQSTREINRIMDEEAQKRPEMKYALERYFRNEQVYSRQERLETSQTQLTWIESQVLGILAEACASLEICFPLQHQQQQQQQLETKLEQQANAFDQRLKTLDARPVRSVPKPHQSAGFAERICHWGSEITRLIHEHEEWKIFLKWREMQPSTAKSANNRGLESSGRLPDLQIWIDYVSYRGYQLKRARDWVAGWQRLLTSMENRIDTYSREGLFILEGTISGIRANVDKFQQNVRNAELRVQSAEEHLAELSSQPFSPTKIQTTQQTCRNPQLPFSPPELESTEGTPKIFNRAYLSSSPSIDHQASRSNESASSGIPNSVQLSNVPSKERVTQAEQNSTDKTQSIGKPDQVITEEDIQLIGAHDSPSPNKAIGDGERAEVIGSPMSDTEDALMTDAQNPIETNAGTISAVHSKVRDIRSSRNSRLPIDQVPTSRKTRPAKKLDQTISSRVLKTAGKKPARKVKAFSKPQTMALLSTTSVKGSPPDSPPSPPPSRISQRIKESAAAPSCTSPPQVNATET